MGEPKLRFKADDGSDFPDWDEMTLGDVGSVAMCKRVFKEQTCEVGDVPFFKIGTFGGAPDSYISQSLFDELKSKYAYPKVGTILLSASGTIGRQVEYKGEDAYYQDSNIVWLEHDDTVLDSYLKQFYTVVKWQGLEGSTIKRLYNKTILDTPFYRPSLPEQRKIADFLSAVDAVIAAQQAEVDAWEQRKKGVMQKLFSQEVRFKADDGSDFPKWEEKTLGEYCTQLKASIDPRKSPNTIFAEYSMPAFDESRKARFVSGREMNSARKILSEPCVLVNKLNVRKRRIWLVKNPEQNAVCSSEFVPLSSNAINLTFLSYFALTDRFTSYLMDCSSGSSNSQKRVVPDVILNYVMQIPSLPEQRKIADCLASMDEAIQKSKDELAKWQELKKGLLQQMFV
ncbi:type I restriction modification DNA specificity domain protein [Bifidobacterium bifidum NCIMB 41171]|uniref:restriction endonuclease subunit S n=1 Tax=Bifidobacterium bifidum TaxID=1681 RepID=UPI0001976770|nr:restriction endonuclease subunit S [Bifidobacterium bifidum]EFR50068.1 type I restriction modification DNA specificity domain protein [Bifidobacterium bifidum NCIMB 41171]